MSIKRTLGFLWVVLRHPIQFIRGFGAGGAK